MTAHLHARAAAWAGIVGGNRGTDAHARSEGRESTRLPPRCAPAVDGVGAWEGGSNLKLLDAGRRSACTHGALPAPHTRTRVSTARHEHRQWWGARAGPRQAPDVSDQPRADLLFLRPSANCHAKFTLAASGTLHAACGRCRSSAQGPAVQRCTAGRHLAHHFVISQRNEPFCALREVGPPRSSRNCPSRAAAAQRTGRTKITLPHLTTHRAAHTCCVLPITLRPTGITRSSVDVANTGVRRTSHIELLCC